MKHYLITGGAGFIGSHLIDYLSLQPNTQITCVDNFDPFYAIETKKANIAAHLDKPYFRLVTADICDYAALSEQLTDRYDAIVHLAAKAGVRPSLEQPREYYATNVGGTQNLLEFAKQRHIRQFVFASSSSVYGTNPRVPWGEEDTNFAPISPYASTKLSAEMLGHVYANLYDIRFIALRFFTVYGPRQRPDLAIHKFTQLLFNNQQIPFYGNGTTRRDYTYVADIVQGIWAAINYRKSKFELINLGNNHTVGLADLVRTIERTTNRTATLQYLPEQPGDVPQTYANINKAKTLLGYQPTTNIETGIELFVQWFEEKHPQQ